MFLEHSHRKPETIFFMVFPCLSQWIQRFPVNKAGLRSVLADGSNLTPLGHPKLGASEFQPVNAMINWSKILKHSYTCVYIYIYVCSVYVCKYIYIYISYRIYFLVGGSKFLIFCWNGMMTPLFQAGETTSCDYGFILVRSYEGILSLQL